MNPTRLRGLTGLAATLWLAAVATTPMAQGQRRDLPDDEGSETVATICGDCHGADRVSAQRRSRVEWQALVEDMAGRNGVATEEDINTIVAYVVKHFGRVNVNKAAEKDLVEIVDLSQPEAAAIVDYRKRQGDYKTLDDLKKVPELDAAKV